MVRRWIRDTRGWLRGSEARTPSCNRLLTEERKFWNKWDARYLQDDTIGNIALLRCEAILLLLRSCSLQKPWILELSRATAGLRRSWLSLVRRQALIWLMGPILEAR